MDDLLSSNLLHHESCVVNIFFITLVCCWRVVTGAVKLLSRSQMPKSIEKINRESRWKAYKDSIKYFVDMNLTEYEMKVLTQVYTVIHGRLINDGRLKSKENGNNPQKKMKCD